MTEATIKAFLALGLAPTASPADAKAAYRQRAHQVHPDKHSSTPQFAAAAAEEMKRLNDAYQTVSDHFQRTMGRSLQTAHGTTPNRPNTSQHPRHSRPSGASPTDSPHGTTRPRQPGNGEGPADSQAGSGRADRRTRNLRATLTHVVRKQPSVPIFIAGSVVLLGRAAWVYPRSVPHPWESVPVPYYDLAEMDYLKRIMPQSLGSYSLQGHIERVDQQSLCVRYSGPYSGLVYSRAIRELQANGWEVEAHLSPETCLLGPSTCNDVYDGFAAAALSHRSQTIAIGALEVVRPDGHWNTYYAARAIVPSDQLASSVERLEERRDTDWISDACGL